MTLAQMKDVIPYTNYTSALEALDNGGRFYNLLTKADDEEISLVELAKVAGVFSDKQKMFLFYEMAVQDLTASDQQSLFTNLSENLYSDFQVPQLFFCLLVYSLKPVFLILLLLEPQLAFFVFFG